MSFDMFLSCFHEGESMGFPRKLFEDSFNAFLKARAKSAFAAERGEDADDWLLLFPDGGRAEMTVDNGPAISGFAVNRPPLSPRYWEGLMNILRHSQRAVYWAGFGCVVADPAVTRHLPLAMIDTLTISIASAPQDILDAIKRDGA